MKIAVFGTGTVGQTIGTKLVELGHQVMMGSRTADNEKAREFVSKNNGNARAGTFADAAAFGELVFNCTAGTGTLEAFKMAGAANLKGKLVIDVSNPLDFSKGMPPTLSVSNTTSLAEMLQEQYPDARIVKSLNTMWCGLMVNPGLIKGDHVVFLSGDDVQAKNEVKAMLKSFGWSEQNMIDLGGIATARGTEMYLPLWLRIYMASGSGAFNIGLVR